MACDTGTERPRTGATKGSIGVCLAGACHPGANVTREQMAAFMNRLGALGPGKTPVVNADKLDGLDSKAFVTHWVTVENGAVRSHSPGLQGVQVIIPDGTTGTYCIRLPASANVEAEAAVGSPQDNYAGFQAYGIAVTTTRGHNCNVVGSWHIAVDTTADGAAINTDFNVIIRGGGIVSAED